MKNHMWKKIVATVCAAALILLTIFQGAAAFATEASAESQTEAEEKAEDTVKPVEKEEGMSMKDVSRIPEDIVIAGIEAGGMTGEELHEEVAKILKEKGKTSLTIYIADEEVEMDLAEAGLCWSNESEVAEAMKTAASGNMIAQYKVSKDIEVGELNTDLVYGVDEEVAMDVMQGILDQFGLEPVDATVEFDGDGFEIIEDIPGVDADLDAALELLLAELDGWKGTALELTIPAEVVEAEIQAEYYEGIGLIAECTTDYWSISSSNRNVNVQLAANNVNGHWFAPGDTISVLEMIGKVDAAHGFLPAGVYVTGDSQDMIGGGLCQIATTIYNCYLQIELQQVLRRPHSMEVDYVPPSMDAMIHPQSGQDCIFINNTGHPLYIQMFTEERNLTCKIYGVYENAPGREVVYRPVVLEGDPDALPEYNEIPDPTMKPGTDFYVKGGHPAYKSQLWKDVYQDGVLVSSECLQTDSYRGMVGTRKYGPAYDDEGTEYYINIYGYAVDENGLLYRLNPEDGSWVDDPLKGYAYDPDKNEMIPNGKEIPTEPEETKKPTKPSKPAETTKPSETTKAPETTTAPESTTSPEESSTEVSAQSETESSAQTE